MKNAAKINEKYLKQKDKTTVAFSKLKDLGAKFELLREENRIFRQFYQKNILEFNKRDIYEREVDEIFADFNKAMNEKNNFIVKNMDSLENTVEGFTYCKSKVLRDFIGRDL